MFLISISLVLKLYSVQFNCVQLFAAPWTAARQASLPSPTPGAHPNPCPSSRWCHPTISFSVVPFSSRPQSFPASGSFQSVSSSHQVAKILELQLQHQSIQWIFTLDFFRIDWFDILNVQRTLKTPPTPQFESINSSILSLLYDPTLTSIHDYWKNQSFDHIDLCRQSDVSAF